MLFDQVEPSDHLNRGQHKEYFCEIILILDQWFRKFHLKIFLFLRLPTPFSVEQNLCAISVEGIMRNISVKFFLIWASGSGEDVI